MPRQDKTGPEGKGPKTGRQFGNCDDAMPIGRGCGPCGCGMRRGFGRCYGGGFGFRKLGMQRVGFSDEEEKKFLETELKEIDLEKQKIEEKLKNLK